MKRVCRLYGPGCSDGGVAVPGKSRCRRHGGGAWAHRPAGSSYSDSLYRQNRLKAIRREPACHWRLPGCTGRSTTGDHVIPLSRGGTHELQNLVGACRSCNEKRGGAEGRATQKGKARRRVNISGKELT